MVLLVVLPSYQKLINEFLLFQYSWLFISVKRRSSEIIYRALERVWLDVHLAGVSRLQLSHWPRKSSLVNELENLVLLVVLPSYQKLINEFLLFQYSWLYVSVKMRSSGIIQSVLERAWLDVHCAGVSRFQLFHWLRNSFLNIVTIEFC